jgi:hypothetical protein
VEPLGRLEILRLLLLTMVEQRLSPMAAAVAEIRPQAMGRAAAALVFLAREAMLPQQLPERQAQITGQPEVECLAHPFRAVAEVAAAADH